MVVLEASGGFGRPVVAAPAATEAAVAMLNPRGKSHFASLRGVLETGALAFYAGKRREGKRHTPKP